MEHTEGELYTLTVATAGERLDRFVAAALPHLSRAAVQRMIESGEITVNGLIARQAYKVRATDQVRVCELPPQPSTLEAEALPLTVLYEDAAMIVLNKAAGMVVHPGAGNPSGTLVNAILAHCPDLEGIGGEIRPGVVHRLDKDTSGVLVIAKNDAAIRALQRQFKQRTVRKVYVALLIGQLPQTEGLIEAPIGRHKVQRQKMAVLVDGKPARTRWRVLQFLDDTAQHRYTLTEVDLLTGRTHQIRVHFAWFGYPLVGDTVYGPATPPLAAPRQFLHARDLTLEHPVTGETLTFTAPLPEDLELVLSSLHS